MEIYVTKSLHYHPQWRNKLLAMFAPIAATWGALRPGKDTGERTADVPLLFMFVAATCLPALHWVWVLPSLTYPPVIN